MLRQTAHLMVPMLHRGLCAAAASPGATACKVGFVGLGQMGLKMVNNLLKSGSQLVAYDSNPYARERAAQLGNDKLKVAESIEDLASTEGMGILFTMLPTPESVREVYLGRNGLLTIAGGPMASLMVDCSTIDPPLARKIAGAADRANLNPRAMRLLEDEESPVMVDAPVSGGVVGAEKGHLSFMVGGDEAAVKVVEPYLLAMGRSITYCGMHGNGQAAKLCNTLVMAASMAAVSESMALARRLGVDPKVMTQVLNTSAGHTWVSEVYNPVPGMNPDAPPSKGYKAGLPVDSVMSQLGMAVMAAEQHHSPVPLTRYVNTLYQQVHDEGLGSKDFSAVFRYLYGSGIPDDHEWQDNQKLFNTQIP